MTDTPLKVERLVRYRLMAKSNAERLEIGCAMFDDAKAMVLAGLRAEYPKMTAQGYRAQLFDRLYGRDLNKLKFARISSHLFRP